MAQTSTSKLIDITVPNDSFTCGVCLADFSNPRNLSCGHIFCLACLDQIQQAKILKCPVCRKVTVMKASVADLGEPVLLKNLQQRAKEVGRICEVCQQNADMHCSDCKSFLCQPCAEKHKARFPEHRCHHQQDVIFCDAHPKQPVTKFCSPCDKCICNLCVFSDHQHHETKDVEEVYSDTLTRFESIRNEQATQPSIETMERVKKRFKYDDLISTANKIIEQSKMLIADVRYLIDKVSLHSEEAMLKLSAITDAIQHNQDAIERGKTVKDADITTGKALIDMKCVLDSVKSDTLRNDSCLFTLTTPKEDLHVILTDLGDLRAKLGLQLYIVCCRKHAANEESCGTSDFSGSDVEINCFSSDTPFGEYIPMQTDRRQLKRSYTYHSYKSPTNKRPKAPRSD